MSISLMTDVWKLPLQAPRKMVLLALADNANDEGTDCWPSVGKLVEKCSMSERAVQGHLAALEEGGYIKRHERLGRSNKFTIHVERIRLEILEKTKASRPTPAESAPSADVDKLPPQNLHPSPSNPQDIHTPAESAPPQNLRPSPAESAPPPAESAPPTPAESAPITIIEPSLNPKGTVKAAQKRSEMVGQIFKIDDVDPLVLQDFVALRKAHKAPLTATAVSDLRTQAAKAGLTLQQVMQECCARGWRGFKAEWLQGRQSSAQRGAQAGQPQSFAQQDREAGWARWEEMTGRVHPDRVAAQQIRPVQDFVIDASAGLVAGGAVFPALEG